MKRILGAVFLALLACVVERDLIWGRPESSLRGFFPADAAREADFEKVFRALPTPERAQQDLMILTQAPHVAGTAEDYKTAHYVLRQFREAGIDSSVVEYQVLLPIDRKSTRLNSSHGYIAYAVFCLKKKKKKKNKNN